MDPERLQEILAGARRAIEQGASTVDVNRRISRLTNGQFPGITSLEIAVDPLVQAEIRGEQQAIEAGENFLPGLGKTALQGAAFGFGDEVLNLFGGDGEGFREDVGRFRETNPGTAMAAELAGSVASPVSGLLGAGFRAVRGAGGVVRSALAGGATGAAGGAVVSAGEAEGDLLERSAAGAAGAVGGAAFGGLLGGGGAILGNLIRPFRGTKQLTRRSVEPMVEQAGLTPDRLPGAVARVSREAGGLPATLADVDPAFGRRVPGLLRRGPGLHRGSGPVRALRARIAPERVEPIKRAIFQPLEKANATIRDKGLMRFFRDDVRAQDALRRIIGQRAGNVQSLTFRQLQSARIKLKDQMRRVAGKDTQAFEDIRKTLDRLDALMETKVPGFLQANRQYRELLSRVEGFEELQKAMDNAFPQADLGLPNRIESISAEGRNAVLDASRRSQQIAESIGEMLLRPDGAQEVQRLLETGFIGKLAGRIGGRVRQTAQTQVGRLFGGTVRLGLEYDPETGEVVNPLEERRGLLDSGGN